MRLGFIAAACVLGVLGYAGVVPAGLAHGQQAADVGPVAEEPPQTGAFRMEAAGVKADLYNVVCERFREPRSAPGAGAGKQGKASDSIHWATYVPEDYQPNQTWGVLIYINSADSAAVSAGWKGLCKKYRLIYASPEGAGNDQDIAWRAALAVEGVNQIRLKYKINLARLYISGISGGGRLASRCGLLLADTFTGTICNCGVDYLRSANPPAGKVSWFSAIAVPPNLAGMARDRGRFALFTGSKDMNRAETNAVYGLMRQDGFRHVTLIEQEGAGHGQMNDANFEKCLAALDEPGVADATRALEIAPLREKAGLLGAAMDQYAKALAAAPAAAINANTAEKLDGLIAAYEKAKAEVQTAVDSGERLKAGAAINNLAQKYAPWANEDVIALRRKLSERKH